MKMSVLWTVFNMYVCATRIPLNVIGLHFNVFGAGMKHIEKE